MRPILSQCRNGNNPILFHNFQQFFRDHRDYLPLLVCSSV
jgi:hypothetical protein